VNFLHLDNEEVFEAETLRAGSPYSTTLNLKIRESVLNELGFSRNVRGVNLAPVCLSVRGESTSLF
jgi:hypothetical protein